MITQLQVLNWILTTRDSTLITTKGLTKDYFPQYSAEFAFINNHFLQYNQIPDYPTFLKVFPNFEVLEVNESIEYLINELTREKTEVYVAGVFNKVRDLITSGKTDEAVKVIFDATNNLSNNSHLDAVDILEDTSRYDDYLEKCNDFSKYYLTTGLKELDDIIGGFDRQEDYVTVSARSGVGKSWILLKFITAAVNKGYNVGVFNGEMTVNKVGYRFDTLNSSLSNWKLVHGNIDIAAKYKDYLEDLKTNHKGHLYVLTRDRINGPADVNALRGFIDKYNLDVLFVDQHSLLDDMRRGRTEFERAANISKDIKLLQVTKHIPIITVSQQNRSKVDEEKGAGTENISNSDRIAQDSTIIIFLSQDQDIMTLNIAKSRDGGTGKKLKYMIDLDHGKFTYIPTEEDSNHTEEDDQPYEYEENPF